MKIYLREKDGAWKLHDGDLKEELAERNIIVGEGARLKAELDIKERAEAAEAKRKLEEQRAAEKAQKDAAAAPDKAKLQAFADSIRAMPIPVLNNEAVRGQIPKL